ncbi:hypothetical protein BJV78DRAFT_1254283 [Lactifluus subvellereus]|nr:hypothetical protein BJV78DRAFT_1254283 [Lactifluus subvellereus]
MGEVYDALRACFYASVSMRVCSQYPPVSPPYVQHPNDPTTLPGFQGTGQVRTEVPVTPYSGNTQANIQTSPPPEYHGLLTV